MSFWHWGKQDLTRRPLYSISPDLTTVYFLVVLTASILAMVLLPMVQWLIHLGRN